MKNILLWAFMCSLCGTIAHGLKFINNETKLIKCEHVVSFDNGKSLILTKKGYSIVNYIKMTDSKYVYIPLPKKYWGETYFIFEYFFIGTYLILLGLIAFKIYSFAYQ